MAAKMPMMAITIISSINVKPFELFPLSFCSMLKPPLLVVHYFIFFRREHLCNGFIDSIS